MSRSTENAPKSKVLRLNSSRLLTTAKNRMGTPKITLIASVAVIDAETPHTGPMLPILRYFLFSFFTPNNSAALVGESILSKQ